MAGDWQETTIGDQVQLQRGFDITKLTQREGRVPVVSTAGVLSCHDTSMANGPGVILGRKGNGIGRAHFITEDYWPHDTTLWVTDFKGNDPKFVFYFFQSAVWSIAVDGAGAVPKLVRGFRPRPRQTRRQTACRARLHHRLPLPRFVSRLIARPHSKRMGSRFDPAASR